MNYDAFLEYISTTPLVWLLLTLSAFKIGIIVYEKSNKNTLLQPIIVAYIIILCIIFLTNTQYEKYFESVKIINFFLGTATVSLALPLYKNIKHIQSLILPMCITLIVAGIFSTLIAIFLLWICDAQIQTILSMTTKSVTAPIAIITSEQIGAIPSLAISFIIITGILGALVGNSIFTIIKIKHDTSKGFALGMISHAIGTARAIEISEKAGAFAALAMGLTGVFTALLLPIIIKVLQ
ncbi:LrgB family protein [Poseidonibacter sp.]|uniref:LrgB family protein n=1 Tax=Poseidonibacter sp. TaxID=2321188 RepID=UPI003C70C268